MFTNSRALYDFLEVIVPGGFFTACLMLIYHHPSVFSTHEITLGALGVFLIVSYAVGHLVQTLSSTIELAFWRTVGGGMPIDWVRTGKRRLLPQARVAQLESQMRGQFDLPAEFTIAGLDGGGWYFLVRQMHALVCERRPMARINELEAGYAINRALACAVFALAILYLLNDPFAAQIDFADEDYTRLYAGITIFMVGILMLYRMQRFGVQYALELLAQFVLLPPAPARELSVPQEPVVIQEVRA